VVRGHVVGPAGCWICESLRCEEAIQSLVVLYETLGTRLMSPDWFRFGASSLLNDGLMQIEYQQTGRYQDPDHFTLD
jgi:deoxyribose-phosphate aldolase